MKTENYGVIFAIVNAGFAEDVMDVARENGARGGTILNVRVADFTLRWYFSATCVDFSTPLALKA